MGLWQAIACDIRSSRARKIRKERDFNPGIFNYAVLTCCKRSRKFLTEHFEREMREGNTTQDVFVASNPAVNPTASNMAE
jgi:hypothetical protein